MLISFRSSYQRDIRYLFRAGKNFIQYFHRKKKTHTHAKKCKNKCLTNVCILGIVCAEEGYKRWLMLDKFTAWGRRRWVMQLSLNVHAVQLLKWLIRRFEVNNFCGIFVSGDWKLQVSSVWENGQHWPLRSHAGMRILKTSNSCLIHLIWPHQTTTFSLK